jgi:BirA family transcriptional regulator, biotin operon repressor / biotin---[acetyl-CoA-carboxylase] ligase
VIAYDVRHHDSIGSTNDEAMRLARDGAPHGTVVCAREQTAGRGRLARRWHSPVGNLYASILLRLDLPPASIAQLSFVAGLAVADAADAFLPDGVRTTLKWPNDVLIDGAKIAGILIESADAAAVVGIGLNIRHAPSDTPYPVTTLTARAANPPDASSVLSILLGAFSRQIDAWLDAGFAPVRAAWLARAHPIGSPLRVSIGSGSIEGRFADLGHDGALIIDTDDGPTRIVAGEVAAQPAK